MAKNQLLQAVLETSTPKILVIGDLILDHYVQGDVTRISPEAPIPIFSVGDEEYKLGGAANVAANVASMGGKAEIIGVLGDDHGAKKFKMLAKSIGSFRLMATVVKNFPTIIKTRFVSQHQQVLRVDEEKIQTFPQALYKSIFEKVKLQLENTELVILSDYGKGVFANETFTQQLITLCQRKNIPVLVDPKGKDYSKYKGATSVTPNRHEAESATGIFCQDKSLIRKAIQKLKSELSLSFGLITLGSGGVALLSERNRLELIPTKARSVFDVTGAGDTFIATLGTFLAQGLSPSQAAQLANIAAGIKVGRFGAYSVSREELCRLLVAEHEAFDYHQKIVSSHDLKLICKGLRQEGQSIVFSNGCFDILHAGHVTYLHFCASQGDKLIIGVNADRSIRRLKGKDRPVNPEDDRIRVLSALADVDFVCVFSESTPEKLIQSVQPDVLVKGADWKGKQVAGADFVKKQGGKVVFAPLLKGRSTSAIIQKIETS